MKKYALLLVGLLAAQGLQAKFIKFEDTYITVQSQFGLCGYFTLDPLFDLGNYSIQLQAAQWKTDQFVKKQLGTAPYQAGDVYNFGSGKTYRVYCQMQVPQGQQAQFTGNGVQFVSQAGSGTGTQASVNLNVQVTGATQQYQWVTVPCNKIFKFGARTSMERSCLSPLAPNNPGSALGMK
jgi:hypothetical protein